MNTYVYIHPDVEQSATASGHLDRIKKLRDGIESDSSTARCYSRPRPYSQYRFGSNFRLLVERHTRDNAEVVVFRHFWKHEKYDSFLARKPDDRDQYFRSNLTPNETIDDRIAKQRGQTEKSTRNLSQTDYAFLSTRPERYDVLESNIVVETHEWCKTIEDWCDNRGKLLVKTMSLSLHKLIERIFEKIESNTLPSSNEVQVETGEAMQILYRYFQDWNILMLIDLTLKPSSTAIRALSERYGIAFTDKNEVKQICRRVYPRLLILGPEEWWEVQSTKKANMVLSAEELTVLDTLRSTDNQSPRYPLFINGRAGSGKSTILQFLFAGVLDVYVQNQEIEQLDTPPIYITYNKQLLDQAKETVTEIRKRSANQLENRPLTDAGLDHASSSIQIDDCFNTVGELMRSLLPASRRQRYKVTNHMTFRKFRSRWDDHRRQLRNVEARELSAGIVWHGIRAYIKGQDIDSPQDYSSLSNDRKSISEDKFTLLFEAGWRWYEQICKEEGLWDDQDLAVELLECESSHLSRFPAIFCDEAQDFTEAELKLIQNLSRFSSYNFSKESHLLRDIPFAFSGDPFQTLNPTGFKWGNIKAMYYENLVHRHGSSNTGRIRLNYHELSRNYRSVSGIIKLSNSIQLIRCLLTNETDTRPQHTQDAPQDLVPQGYVLDGRQKLVESRIRESAELVIIVPCEEGEEDDFVHGDKFLKSLVDEEPKNKLRIMGPLQAKGLEWERVVVYRFGEFALRKCKSLCDFLQCPEQEKLHVISENERFMAEYFLNKLYVAVTRPRTRLFLADSQQAIHAFWQFANDASIGAKLLNINTSMSGWSSMHLGGFEIGNDDSWDEDRDSPTQIAVELENQGRGDGDTTLLERARYYFGIDGDQAGQDRCDAQIAELSGAFDEAAKIYAKLNDWRSALRCRWVSGEWSKIASAGETGVPIDESSEAATLLKAANILNDDRFQRRELEDLLNSLRGKQRHIFVREQSYATGLEKFFSTVIERLVNVNFKSDSSWSGIPDVMEKTLRELHVSDQDMQLRLAEVFHNAGDLQSAIRIWRAQHPGQQPKSGRDPMWAVRAAVASMGVHERLKVLEQSGDYEGVSEAWFAIVNSSETITSDIVQMVVEMARRGKDLSAPFDALARVKSDVRWILAVDILGSRLDDASKEKLSCKVITALVNRLALSKDWKRISELCEHDLTESRPLHKIRRDWHWKRSQVLAVVADVLARSVSLQDRNAQDAKAVRQHFVRRYLWQGDSRGRGSRKAPPDLRIVLRWLGGIRVLSALIEGVCSCEEARGFYSSLYSTLQRGNASESDLRFARERLAFCVSNLPKRPASFDKFLKEWNISVSDLSTSVELPPVSDAYYEGLLSGNVSSAEAVESVSAGSSTTEVVADHGKLGPSSDEHELAMSVSTELIIRYEDRIINGKISQIKQRIILSDTFGNLVLCGPERVDSSDVTVESIRAGSDSQWLISEWGIECRIDRRGSERIIQFLLASGAIFPRYVFEISSDDKE